jgi:hypothetical protein
MAFLLDYLSWQWNKSHSDDASLKEWQHVLDVAEKDRQRE